MVNAVVFVRTCVEEGGVLPEVLVGLAQLLERRVRGDPPLPAPPAHPALRADLWIDKCD